MVVTMRAAVRFSHNLFEEPANTGYNGAVDQRCFSLHRCWPEIDVCEGHEIRLIWDTKAGHKIL